VQFVTNELINMQSVWVRYWIDC